MVFHGSRLVLHGFRSVLRVFHGYRLVFHGFRSVLMVFHGPRWVFHCFRSVFHGFSWSQVGFSWFQVGFSCFCYGSRFGFHDARWICIVMNGPRLVYFRAERSVMLRTPKSYSLYPYLGPTIPLGLAGRRPALA